MSNTPKFRIVYAENSYTISGKQTLFTGSYSSLEQIQERVEYFIPSNPALTIEYYTHSLGYTNRKKLDAGLLPNNLETIYVYLRSKIPMACHICDDKFQH